MATTVIAAVKRLARSAAPLPRASPARSAPVPWSGIGARMPIRRFGRWDRFRRSGYSKRAMVESAIYRYKTIINRSTRSRARASQRVEVQLACGVLNTTTRLGMPDSYRVA